MSSPIGSKNNVKIFVLYLMENIGYPMDYVTIHDIVMQNDYVMFLDFAESFNEMLDTDLIAAVTDDPAPLYAVTEKGRIVARELKSDLLPTILDKSMECALRFLDFRRRGVETRCYYEKRKDGKCDFTCKMTEKQVEIFSVTVTVDTEERARQMKDNFNDRPEVIYRGLISLLAGKVNYLFNP